MFCRKCGAQLNEGAVFCPKCGTKVAVESTAKQSEGAIHVAEERQNVYAMAQNDAVSFRNFVDNHVRSKTTFSSAADLITNSRPWRFVWISMGIGLFIGFLIGIISESVVVSTLLIGGILGYIALLLSGAIIRGNYCQKFCGEYEQDIDMNELLAFLNEHLRLVSPYFHECGYFSQRGGLLTIMDNAAIRMAKKVILCCKCGSRKKNLAAIYIRPDDREENSGKMLYAVGAEHGGFMLDRRMSSTFSHACLIRTAPIMQAAMLYYLQNK